jgi:ABC-type amino acid transport system permease subunit
MNGAYDTSAVVHGTASDLDGNGIDFMMPHLVSSATFILLGMLIGILIGYVFGRWRKKADWDMLR